MFSGAKRGRFVEPSSVLGPLHQSNGRQALRNLSDFSRRPRLIGILRRLSWMTVNGGVILREKG